MWEDIPMNHNPEVTRGTVLGGQSIFAARTACRTHLACADDVRDLCGRVPVGRAAGYRAHKPEVNRAI